MDSMNKGNFSHSKKAEAGLTDLIQILNRRKKTILLITVFTLILVLIYNFFALPVYEATVTLKKEVTNNRGRSDEFKEMFSMRTMDEIDTEIESIKSKTVFKEVIKELDLLMYIKNIDFSDGEMLNIDGPLLNYEILYNNYDSSVLPRLSNVNIDITNSMIAKPFYIKVTKLNTFELYEEESNTLVQSASNDSIAVFDLGGLHFELSWPSAKNDDKIYFEIVELESALKKLNKNITIEPTGKTNIFSVSYRSRSTATAKLIANTIVEKYRDNRFKLKRQTTNYTYNFVDDQLKEISDKLESAEIALSRFKSENKIIDINENSSEIVGFLSNLESKKIEAELELDSYRNKIKEMKKEQKNKDYIDQTYLAPNGVERNNSPFSTLLEQLSDTEIKRLELLQKRKVDHPEVKTLDDQITQIKTRLAEYNQTTITSYQIIINTLEQKLINLNRLINKYSSKLESLPEQETTFIKLLREKDAFEKKYKLLFDKREELRIAEFSKLQDIVIFDEVYAPNKPVAPKKVLNLLLSLFFGLISGTGIAFIQEFLEKNITSIDEVERLYSSPILAAIPEYKKDLQEHILQAEKIEHKIVSLLEDQDEYLESYRLLRTKLYALAKNGKNTFIFTSAEANSGKSTVVSNLGVSLARSGKKVLLVDCDLKRAGLTQTFSVPDDFPNLEQYLKNDINALAVFKPFNNNSSLDVNLLSAGKGDISNSSELLELEKMKRLLEISSSKYDYILIDSPPVNLVVDTLVLGNHVQNVILIVRPNHSTKEGVKFSLEEIKQSSLNVCGFVVNACNLDKSSNKYKFGYGYGSGYDE